jgi:hypothetical protein
VEESRVVNSSRPAASRPAWIAVLLAAAAFWTVDLGWFGHGVPHLLDDTWEYAVSAEHLLAGDGFVTRVIHPPLHGLADGAGRVPLLIHGPLLPLVFAAVLALAGPGAVDQVAWLAAAFAVLAAVLVYAFVARHFGAAAGAAAAMLYTLSPLTLEAVHHDVALAAGAALLAAALLALFPGSDVLGPREPRAFVAGLLLGAGYLVRPEFLLLLPLLPFAAPARAWTALFGFALIALPWWVHHFLAVGVPWFNLSSYLVIGYHGRYPDLTVLRDFDLPPAAWPAALREALPDLPAKWAQTLPRALKRALLAPWGPAGALAALGFVVALASRARRRIAAWAFAAALIPVAVMTLTIYDERYLSPFMPIWCAAAAAGAAALAARLPAPVRASRVWIPLLALLALPPAASAWRAAHADAPASRLALAAEREVLAGGAARAPAPSAPAPPMFSDTPDFAAWTTGRPVIWVTRAEYSALPDCAGDGAAAEGRPCRSGREGIRFHP